MLDENVAEVLLELGERATCTAFSTGRVARRSAASRWASILKHFGLPLDSIESVCKNDSPEFADRPSNLTFELSPIVSKLKTQPVNFEQQLEALTRIEPLRG